MKLEIKVGSKVKVTQGKFAGKDSKVIFIDKKNLRFRLDGLKVIKSKGKKGGKDLHGTFHLSSLSLIKPEQPTEASAETAAQA